MNLDGLGLKAALPRQAHPSFFETTVVEVEDPANPLAKRIITHFDIEEILAQPAWDVRDMQEKATANLVLRGWTKNFDGVMVPPEKRPAHQVVVTKKAASPKKTAKKKPTPKKKP